MAKVLHAIEYLARPQEHPPQAVCVAFGDELFLRRQVLLGIRAAVLGDEGDFSLATFAGEEAEFRDVLEELATVAMFGGRRLVIVEEADDFVTRYRAELEAYVSQPSRCGTLVLDVKSWPSNTRIYKAVLAAGLAIDCNAPVGSRLTRWLGDWARQTHGVQLSAPVAEMLVEMIGPEVGLIDQELARLALMTAADKKITLEMVQRLVGGWRAKTAWVMLDAALDGNTAAAMAQLDRLLSSGEAPIGLLAQISASLRRLAAATRRILQAEAAGRRVTIEQALQQAGVKPFAIGHAQQQLRRLGRVRGNQLYRQLLQADLDMKGASNMSPRLVLERLIVRLSAPQESPSPAGRGPG
jgi:DNA polymerase III subunit delta